MYITKSDIPKWNWPGMGDERPYLILAHCIHFTNRSSRRQVVKLLACRSRDLGFKSGAQHCFKVIIYSMNDIVLKWSKTKPNPTNVPNTGTIRYNLDYRKNNYYGKNKYKANINPLQYLELRHYTKIVQKHIVTFQELSELIAKWSAISLYF